MCGSLYVARFGRDSGEASHHRRVPPVLSIDEYVGTCIESPTFSDCFKYRHKVGIDVAVEALRDFSRRYRGGATELAHYARLCRVSRVMQPYLDAIP